MKVSKHHYAIELAKRDNDVYFIEPPDKTLREHVAVYPIENERLKLVKYNPVFFWKRILPAFLYNRLLKKQVDNIVSRVGKKPDVVLSFQPFLFENIKDFGAEKSIYFAADLSADSGAPGEIVNADICFAVSSTILAQVKQYNEHTYFINHGLNANFASIANTALQLAPAFFQGNKKMRVGYAGNLLMGAPDHKVMKQVISSNPEIEFVFWGQYDMKEGKHDALNSPEVLDFIEFLKNAENVVLKGAVPSVILANEMQEMDMFWLCWKIGPGMWDGSNSHKILEYLSTGRPVVSHFVLTYRDSHLLFMPETTENDGYPILFKAVVREIQESKIPVIDKQRIAFALDNTYSKQIDRIEAYL